MYRPVEISPFSIMALAGGNYYYYYCYCRPSFNGLSLSLRVCSWHRYVVQVFLLPFYFWTVISPAHPSANHFCIITKMLDTLGKKGPLDRRESKHTFVGGEMYLKACAADTFFFTHNLVRHNNVASLNSISANGFLLALVWKKQKNHQLFQNDLEKISSES